jgi:biopolymer transport protein ExbB
MKSNVTQTTAWKSAALAFAVSCFALALTLSRPAWADDGTTSVPQEQSAGTTPAPVATPPAPLDAAPTLAPGQTAQPQLEVPAAAPPGDTVAPTISADPAPSAAIHGVDAASLPHDLSPWSMFQSADIVVKAVMIGLAFASVVTWTVWLAKSFELAIAKRKLARALRAIHSSKSLAEASDSLAGRRSLVAGFLDLAKLELRLSSGIADKSAIKERVASRLDGLALAAARDINTGTGVLATIGSTAPFVGLFGTVWGIMNSFIGISESQTTNLAIVAPGIAEALLATAIGLVAAIPAVIIYNMFARSISSFRAAIAEASAEVQRLVSRDLDRGVAITLPQAAE